MSEISYRLEGADRAVLVVVLPPRVVDDTADALLELVERRLPDVGGAGVLLDLSAVEMMNSIGITALLQVQDHCRRRGAGMGLAAMSGPIARFLSQLKLDKRFPVFGSIEDGIQSAGS